MKHFVYGLYSPSFNMVKIGMSSNLEKRWKDLAHWHFDENKSFALYCTSKRAQKRIEDTLKVFFQLHPALDGGIPHRDGYTECFDKRIIDDLKDFFQYFSKRYSHEYSYVENIKPFIGFPTIFTGMKEDEVVDHLVKNSMLHTNNDGTLDIYYGFKENISNF